MNLEKVVANLIQKVEHRFYGKYRGFIVNNADPEKLGRLRLRVPSILGKEVVTGWAMPCVPYGGKADQGFLFIPEVGAGVWVEFEEGDLEFPIWVGTFWSKPGGESELPKANDEVQAPPTQKIIKTKKGHTIQLEDADGEEKIIVKHKDGAYFSLHKDGSVIIQNKNGSTISLDAENQNMLLAEEHGNYVCMNDKEGVVIVSKGGDVSVVLSGDQATVRAKEIFLQGATVVIGQGAVDPTLVLDPVTRANLENFLLHTHPVTAVASFTGPPISTWVPPLAPGKGLSCSVMVK